MPGFFVRHGRFVLVAGLLLGALLPDLAAFMANWLTELIVVLLFLNAFRSGGRFNESLSGRVSGNLQVILILQLALPIAGLGLFAVFGVLHTAFAFGALLLLAAPSITGAPNMSSMLGHDPRPAMRLLVIGTALFPFTAFLVLWVVPDIGVASAFLATGKLALTILCVAAAGYIARRVIDRATWQQQLDRTCDNITSVLLAVLVIGLMVDVGPLLYASPLALAGWLAGVMALNFGLQIIALLLLRARGHPDALPIAIVSGNRNLALFLVALPPEQTQLALMFIGCYQIPMYLTPIILRRLA